MHRDPPAPFRAAVRAIADNRIDGAHALALQSAAAMDLLSPQDDLMACADLLCAAQPSMAPLVHAAELLRSTRDPQGAARMLRRALEFANSQVAAQALPLIPQTAVILTHSASATVEYALRSALDAGREIRVFATESLPGGEGRVLAAALNNGGIHAELVPDIAMRATLRHATLAMTGADWISPSHVINKVGTAELCRAARDLDKPVYCLASSLKFAPFDPPPDSSGLFEPIPIEWFSAVITNAGIHRAPTAGK